MEQTQFSLQDFLFDLLRIPSPSGDEDEVAAFLVQSAEELLQASARAGAENGSVRTDEAGNVILSLPGSSAAEPMLWCAHMDTVPNLGTIDPINDNGIIRNAGSGVPGLDNKAAIACFFAAAMRLKDGSETRPIEILLTREEETTGAGALGLDVSMIRSRRGITIDAAMPLGTVITASPWGYDMDWTVSGPTGHVKNLSMSATFAWDALRDIISTAPFGAGRPNVNWSAIRGGDERNTITSRFVLQGELRDFDEAAAKDFVASQQARATELGSRYPDLDIRFSSTSAFSGYEVPGDDPWLTQIAASMRAIGIEPELATSFGLADVNILRTKGINMVNIADNCTDTHSPAERAPLSGMERIVDLLVQVARFTA